MSEDSAIYWDWDPQQRAVIQAPVTDRMLIQAGPGTGKTAVACARVASLIDEQDANPSSIWLLSFTRTAVREIRHRIGVYVAHPADALSVRITTLDSQVWYLRQGLDNSNFADLFGSFDVNIEQITAMLREGNEQLLQYISEIEHIILDEAQDLVGVRAALLRELIDRIPPTCGITVFADSAQAIYGFTNDADGKNGAAYLELVPELGELGGIREHTLERIYRTDDKALASAYQDLRRFTLAPSTDATDKLEELKEKVRKVAKSSLPAVEKQDLKDRTDTLVLFRYRADVMQASSFLWSNEVPHKLRISGMPQRLSPWVARIFWDYQQKSVTAEDFGKRWDDRVSSNKKFGRLEYEQAWTALLHYCGNRRGSIEMKQVRRVLSRKKPPIEFILAETMLRGPVLGTIHASKGREADRVHLMLPRLNGYGERTFEQIDEEGRVIFVGATRARNELNVGEANRSYAGKCSRSSRAFKVGRRKKSPRAQVEFGLDGDIDRHQLLFRDEWDDESTCLQNQEYLWAHSLDHVPVHAEKSADTDWQYWLHADDDSCDWLGSLSKNCINDLWCVADAVKERYEVKKAMPNGPIKYLHMVGSESVVLAETDDLRSRLLEPWSTTGIYLVPVVSGFTNVYFRS